MSGISIDDWKLQLQANQIFNVSSRITRAMIEIALQSKQMQTCVSTFKLEQSIETRCYSEFSTIWSQFDSIGQKHSTTLFDHVKTIQQFKGFDSFQLECLIGKATAQKLRESVTKLPIFTPQMVDIRFVDKNLATQECKWEVQITIQRSHSPRECRVNILAGLWHGVASVVKRHYLLQETGSGDCITFTVTTKPSERNIIVHLAVLSCSHAGIDREVFYKCAINWVDAKTPSLGRIEEINETTLEVLGKKKPEIDASKDFVGSIEENDRWNDAQPTQAKKNPKQTVSKECVAMIDESLTFTEKQLSLLPNKALKSVSGINRKQAEQRLELSDDEDEMAFQEELFQHMDHPQSSDQPHKNLNYEFRGESQRNHQSLPHDTSSLQRNPAFAPTQSSVSNHFEHNSPLEPLQKSNYNSQLWRNQADNIGLQWFEDGKKEPINENRNPFESFTYKPMRSDFQKDRQSSEKSPVSVSVFSKTCEQRGASAYHLKKSFDADPSFVTVTSQKQLLSSDTDNYERKPYPAAFEQQGRSANAQRISESKLPAPPQSTGNAGMVQVCLHCTRCASRLLLQLTPIFVAPQHVPFPQSFKDGVQF